MLIHPYRTSLSLFSLLGFLFRRNFLIQNILFSRKTNDIWCQLCSQYCHVFQKPNDCLSLSYNEKRKSLSDSFRLYWTDWNWHTNQLSMSLVIFFVSIGQCACGYACASQNSFSFVSSLTSQRNLCVKTIQVFQLSFKKERETKATLEREERGEDGNNCCNRHLSNFK